MSRVETVLKEKAPLAAGLPIRLHSGRFVYQIRKFAEKIPASKLEFGRGFSFGAFFERSEMGNEFMDRSDGAVRNPNTENRAEADGNEKRADEFSVKGLELDVDEREIGVAGRESRSDPERDHVSEKTASDGEDSGEPQHHTKDVRQNDRQLKAWVNEIILSPPESRFRFFHVFDLSAIRRK